MSMSEHETGGSRTRLLALLDYLARLARLNQRVVDNVDAHRLLTLHQHALESLPGISRDTHDENGAVWLRVERLQRTSPPAPDGAIAPWLNFGNDPLAPPALVTESAPRDTLVPQARLYIEGPWREWRDTEAPRRETIRVYEQLFTLHRTLEAEGSENPLELLFGVGLARCRREGRALNTPVLELPVELELESDSALLIRPLAREPRLALEPFAAGQPDAVEQIADALRERLRQLVEEGNELSPFHPEGFAPVLRTAATLLDEAGRYLGDEEDASPLPPLESSLVVTEGWVLFARKRSENSYLRDLERLAVHLADERTHLPHPARMLVEEHHRNQPESTALDFRSAFAAPPASGPESEAGTDHGSFLFPLPYNEAQQEIMRRLERDDTHGVLVQGPPGTGKSHTIANIICHYLATGRRVLVTSKGEAALRVVRDMLPAPLRPLTITLTAGEREGLRQLEQAVELLSEEIAQTDLRHIESEMRAAMERNESLSARLERLQEALHGLAVRHLTPPPAHLTAHLEGGDAVDLARWCAAAREHHDWFTDRPGGARHAARGFGAEEIEVARAARRALGVEISHLGKSLPETLQLPDLAHLLAAHADLSQLERIERLRSEGAIAPLAEHAHDALERATRLRDRLLELETLEEDLGTHPWLLALLRTWMREHALPDFYDLFGEVREMLRILAERRHAFIRRPVEVPTARPPRELRDAVERAATGERPFGLLNFGGGEIKALYERIRVEGERPRDPETWRHVADHFKWLHNLGIFAQRWSLLAPELGLGELPPSDDALGSWLSESDRLIAQAEHAAGGLAAEVRSELPQLFPHGLDAEAILMDAGARREAIAQIDANLAKARLGVANASVAQWCTLLEEYDDAPICREMLEFITTRVGNGAHGETQLARDWEGLLARLERVRTLRGEMERLWQVAQSIHVAGAPRWAARLLSEACETESDPLLPEGWEETWLWGCAEGFLDDLEGKSSPAALNRERREVEGEIKQNGARLIALAVFRALALRIQGSPRIGAALATFATAMRQMGGGTGKRAPRFRRMAREAMAECYDAVPCWIAPTWRVSEMLPSQCESFDLVIFDEASQSDIGALPTLLRGAKVLIVGDDRQVSPTAGFIEEALIRSLRRTHLQELPHGDLMLPGNSLYDLAGALYPGGRIMLTEHFRCVEPIIRFSDRFYNRPVIPLRVPRESERLDPPLIDVHLPDGVREKRINHLEAEAIVAEVERIVASPEGAGRTIGIISLTGLEQAQLIDRLLVGRLAPETLTRHAIECGDSATFQGKEKHIVLLSMIASPGQARPLSGLMYEQRFNVAVSRARDRLYLFRSVTPEELSPRDLRLALIRHMQAPMPEERVDFGIERCESAVERDLYRRLTALGYRVSPQVQSGQFRIDLVVEGAGDRRLAVELDGDKPHPPEKWLEDFARQRVLERVGWHFWRGFASSLIRNPEAVMEELTSELHQLGIAPTTPSAEGAPGKASSHYTERRTYRPQKAESTAAPPATMESICVGDRLVVRLEGDNRHRAITLTDAPHDPDNGRWNIAHPDAEALLGADEEGIVELSIAGATRLATILRIERGATQTA